jgi:hypothetical protein
METRNQAREKNDALINALREEKRKLYREIDISKNLPQNPLTSISTSISNIFRKDPQYRINEIDEEIKRLTGGSKRKTAKRKNSKRRKSVKKRIYKKK